MAREGDVIENPVSGARIVFRKTARNTNGELLQFDLFFKPHLIGGAPPSAGRSKASARAKSWLFPRAFPILFGTTAMRRPTSSLTSGQP